MRLYGSDSRPVLRRRACKTEHTRPRAGRGGNRWAWRRQSTHRPRLNFDLVSSTKLFVPGLCLIRNVRMRMLATVEDLFLNTCKLLRKGPMKLHTLWDCCGLKCAVLFLLKCAILFLRIRTASSSPATPWSAYIAATNRCVEFRLKLPFEIQTYFRARVISGSIRVE